jgi:hypothetical protein
MKVTENDIKNAAQAMYLYSVSRTYSTDPADNSHFLRYWLALARVAFEAIEK